MKNAMKSYLVFTSRLYRLVMYMLLPGVCGGICLWACGSGGSRAGRGVLMAAALLLPMVETVSDSWLFAGVQNLSYTNLEYLKSSGRGGAVMRQALTVDVLRKLVSSAVILGLAYAIIGLWELLSGEIKEGLWAGAVEGAFGFWGAGSGTRALSIDQELFIKRVLVDSGARVQIPFPAVYAVCDGMGGLVCQIRYIL